MRDIVQFCPTRQVSKVVVSLIYRYRFSRNTISKSQNHAEELSSRDVFLFFELISVVIWMSHIYDLDYHFFYWLFEQILC